MKSIIADEYKMISFTDKGYALMKTVAQAISGEEKGFEECVVTSLKEWTKENFQKGNVLLFIGACGIAVRAIAPYIRDKANDPAVLVMDEKGDYVIPVLSGHLGGAVKAARKIAETINATCVLTTATDVEGEFAVDVFASDNNMIISDMKRAKEFTAKLLKTGESTYFADAICGNEKYLSQIPSNIKRCTSKDAEMIISPLKNAGDKLQLIPKCIVAGMGCKKGKTKEELKEVLLKSLDEINIDVRAVKAIASVSLKKDEAGLLELCSELGAEFITFDSEKLMEQKGEFTASEFVKGITGVDNVCERAVAAYGCTEFLLRKRAENGVTVAVGSI